MKTHTKNWFLRLACLALVGIGLLQPIGLFFSSKVVRGVGLATTASPLPLVFTHFRGYEPFAADYWVSLELTDGEVKRFELTPELYGKLSGPYNRRNPYGAVIAAGPKMIQPSERALWESVIDHGFCNNGALTRDFGVAGNVQKVTVSVVDQTAGADRTWDLPWECRS